MLVSPGVRAGSRRPAPIRRSVHPAAARSRTRKFGNRVSGPVRHVTALRGCPSPRSTARYRSSKSDIAPTNDRVSRTGAYFAVHPAGRRTSRTRNSDVAVPTASDTRTGASKTRSAAANKAVSDVSHRTSAATTSSAAYGPSRWAGAVARCGIGSSVRMLLGQGDPPPLMRLHTRFGRLRGHVATPGLRLAAAARWRDGPHGLDGDAGEPGCVSSGRQRAAAAQRRSRREEGHRCR